MKAGKVDGWASAWHFGTNKSAQESVITLVLHYTTYRHDGDVPWVVFVHGAGGSRLTWFKQVRDFRDQYNVLLVDLRGHGKSTSTARMQSTRYTFRAIAHDVIEVLDHLNIAAAHFVGVSMGTIIIRAIGEYHPGRVQGMVMAGAVMWLGWPIQVLMRMSRVMRHFTPYLWLYTVFAWLVMPRRKQRATLHLFVREAHKLQQAEFNRWHVLLGDVNRLLAGFRQHDPDIPTCYIMGEEDHFFLPAVRKLSHSHRSAELQVIAGCGHVVNVERPAVFNRSAMQFLKQLG